jgi:hypothetical protein
MQCVAFDEFGQVVSATTENCVYVLVESGDYFAAASLDAASIAESFSWGFGTVISLWFASYCVKVALKTIKAI